VAKQERKYIASFSLNVDKINMQILNERLWLFNIYMVAFSILVSGMLAQPSFFRAPALALFLLYRYVFYRTLKLNAKFTNFIRAIQRRTYFARKEAS